MLFYGLITNYLSRCIGAAPCLDPDVLHQLVLSATHFHQKAVQVTYTNI